MQFPLSVLLLATLFSTFCSSAATYLIDSYPTPFRSGACNSGRGIFLCDPDNLLEHHERELLAKLIAHFADWTTNENATNVCKRRGIQLGIALSRQPILEQEDQSHWAEVEASPALKAMLTNLRNNLVGEFLAKKWLMAEDEKCPRLIMLLVTAEPLNLHIYSPASVPLMADEKKHIIAAEAQALNRHDYANAVKDVVAALRTAIKKRETDIDFEEFRADITTELRVELGKQRSELEAQIANLPKANGHSVALSVSVSLMFSALIVSAIIGLLLFLRRRHRLDQVGGVRLQDLLRTVEGAQTSTSFENPAHQ